MKNKKIRIYYVFFFFFFLKETSEERKKKFNKQYERARIRRSHPKRSNSTRIILFFVPKSCAWKCKLFSCALGSVCFFLYRIRRWRLAACNALNTFLFVIFFFFSISHIRVRYRVSYSYFRTPHFLFTMTVSLSTPLKTSIRSSNYFFPLRLNFIR